METEVDNTEPICAVVVVVIKVAVATQEECVRTLLWFMCSSNVVVTLSRREGIKHFEEAAPEEKEDD